MAITDTATDQYGLGSPATLEKIDKLFACGVGELVNLPQIVVVGDQSSGKSSVLEGLIKKPLPRDSGLCTRFATQIVFRRASQTNIQVSIIPEPGATDEHVAKLKAWNKTVASLDSKAFTDIMKEVHEVMGLSNGGASTGAARPTFSNDVLRLEISGPQEEHFSVIDVPGIFKSTTEGLTTKNDIQLVRNMVKGYMNNSRCVILAVIPANVDVATQEILELATEADPHQDRTLGVLTKPDLVDRGAEPAVIKFLEGRARPMKLGWHMLRNPGQTEMSEKGLNRDVLEMDFFRSRVPWNSIDKSQVGVDALRMRLKAVLDLVVKKEFPKVKAEIKTRLTNREKKLNDLGQQRSNSTEQTAFLTGLAVQFQRLVGLALTASHGADDVFDTEPALRLSPQVMKRMQVFSDDMAEMGEMYSFVHPDDDASTSTHVSEETANPAGSASETLPSSDVEDSSESDTTSAELSTRKQDDLEELLDILCPQELLLLPKQGTIEWLTDVFDSHRGFEMGTFNATILPTILKKQASKWPDLSIGLVSDVIVMVHRFIVKVISSICSDEGICSALVNTLFDDLTQRYRAALRSANFLVKVEFSRTPLTMNHYFNDNLQKSRQDKLKSRLKPEAYQSRDRGYVVGLDQVVEAQAMGNDDHIILEIHDILHSYYRVCRKRFVDNVCTQSVMYFLLHPEDGPLALFSPTFVSGLSPSQLEEIAGEAPDVRRLRSQLAKEVASLREATKILARA